MSATPRSADFDTFVVTERGLIRGGGYNVRVHKNLAYLFEGGHGSGDGTRPGWLGMMRFETYADAVTFGERLAPLIEAAHEAHNAHCAAVSDATTLIFNAVNQYPLPKPPCVRCGYLGTDFLTIEDGNSVCLKSDECDARAAIRSML